MRNTSSNQSLTWQEMWTNMVNHLQENRTKIAWGAFSITMIVLPEIIGLNILTAAIVTVCLATQYLPHLVNWWNGTTSASSTADTKMSMLGFIKEITYASGRAPLAIAICSTMCILSTNAPIATYFYNLMNKALTEGSSLSTFITAAQYYAAWQICYLFARNVFAKVYSQNIGADQGILIMSLFAHKKIQDAGKNTQNDKNMNRADDIPTNFWYFTQTIVQSVISIISSITAVLQTQLPSSLHYVRNSLIKRYLGLSVLINITSIWFTDNFVTEVRKKRGTTQNELPEAYNKLSTAKAAVNKASNDQTETAQQAQAVQEKIYTYRHWRVLSNWRAVLQDLFQGLPKAINDNNNFTLLLIVLSFMPSFPLGSSSLITLAQIFPLASTLKTMLIDALVISRNAASYSEADSKFSIINGDPNKNQNPAFESKKEIHEFYVKLPEASLPRTTWQQDLIDSIAIILMLTTSAELFCLHTGTSLIGAFFSTSSLWTTLTATLGYTAWQINKLQQSQKNDEGDYLKNARYTNRISNAFCNSMVTLLCSRMLCMFHAYLPEALMFSLSLGLSSSFWPQIMISAITINLTMTLLVTPNLVPVKTNHPTFTKDLHQTIIQLPALFMNILASLRQAFTHTYNKTVATAKLYSAVANAPIKNSAKTPTPNDKKADNPTNHGLFNLPMLQLVNFSWLKS